MIVTFTVRYDRGEAWRVTAMLPDGDDRPVDPPRGRDAVAIPAVLPMEVMAAAAQPQPPPASTPAAAPLQSATQPAPTGRFVREVADAAAARYLRKPGNIGVLVGAVHGGQRHVFGYGRVSLESRATPDGKTLFEIGSITKVFTAILMEQMAGEGLLAIDDPVQKHLPATVRLKPHPAGPMTLRHLASHTSGLPGIPPDLAQLAAREPANPYLHYTEAAMDRFLSHFKPTRRPGERYEYSNFGGGLLGRILARRSGTSYEAAMRGRICRPLGLNDTLVTLWPEQWSRLATGHAAGKPTPPWDNPALPGAGALRSTGDDMVAFLSACLHPCDPPLAAAMRACEEPQAEMGDKTGWKVALGWHVVDAKDIRITWHNGGTGGYRSWIGFERTGGVGVIILSNSDDFVDQTGFDVLTGLLAGVRAGTRYTVHRGHGSRPLD